jgi:hypothetical protein
VGGRRYRTWRRNRSRSTRIVSALAACCKCGSNSSGASWTRPRKASPRAGPVLSFNSGHQQKCSQSCSSLIIPRITSAQLLPPVETSLSRPKVSVTDRQPRGMARESTHAKALSAESRHLNPVRVVRTSRSCSVGMLRWERGQMTHRSDLTQPPRGVLAFVRPVTCRYAAICERI